MDSSAVTSQKRVPFTDTAARTSNPSILFLFSCALCLFLLPYGYNSMLFNYTRTLWSVCLLSFIFSFSSSFDDADRSALSVQNHFLRRIILSRLADSLDRGEGHHKASTRKKRRRHSSTSMLRVEFETKIQMFEWLKTASVLGPRGHCFRLLILSFRWNIYAFYILCTFRCLPASFSMLTCTYCVPTHTTVSSVLDRNKFIQRTKCANKSSGCLHCFCSVYTRDVEKQVRGSNAARQHFGTVLQQHIKFGVKHLKMWTVRSSWL
jgi:hypothetical protein